MVETPQKILKHIKGFQQERGYSPSFREIAAALGLSESTVAYHLSRLRDQGVVTYAPRSSRSVQIVKDRV